MAELADAHGSGPCASNGLGVQISSGAPPKKVQLNRLYFFVTTNILKLSYIYINQILETIHLVLCGYFL